MRIPRPRLNYSNVIATIALFVALGGAAVAAGLPKNSVGTKQLKRGAVTAAKLKRGAVTSGKIGPQAVTAGKLGANAVLPGNLGNGVISAEKLGDGSVIASKIKNGVVTGNKLTNGAVTTAKLGDGAVNTGKLADGAVTPAKLSVPLGGTVSTLQSGQTLRGVFDIGGRSGGPQGKIEEHWSQSFPIPLLNAPNADEANIMKPGTTSANCPGITGGNAATPQAAPGQHQRTRIRRRQLRRRQRQPARIRTGRSLQRRTVSSPLGSMFFPLSVCMTHLMWCVRHV